MKDISLLIPPALRPWLLGLFSVFTVVVGSAMMKISARVKPSPIWFEFPWTQRGADEILGQWDGAAKDAVRKNLLLDFVFIASYVGGLVVAGAMASEELGVEFGAAPWAGAAITWAVIAAGLLDVCENIGQFAMLGGRRGPVWPLLTSVCATVKFILVFIAATYALCGLNAPLICFFQLHQ